MSDDLHAKLRQAAEAYRHSIKIEQVARMEFARACAALALEDAALHAAETGVVTESWLRARAEEIRRGES